MRSKRTVPSRLLVIVVFYLFFLNYPATSFSAVNEDLLEAAKSGDEGKVKGLLDKGADINAKDANGFTSLIWAAFMGHAKVVELLLDKGANANAKTTKEEVLYNPPGFTKIPAGSTALMAAGGDIKVVKALLNKGADVNARSSDDSTVLMMVLFSGHTEVVKLLVEKGADVNAKNKYGTTALKIAGNKEIAEVLKKGGAKE